MPPPFFVVLVFFSGSGFGFGLGAGFLGLVIVLLVRWWSRQGLGVVVFKAATKLSFEARNESDVLASETRFPLSN